MAGQCHVGRKDGAAARTDGPAGMGCAQVALVQVAVGEHLLARPTLVHRVLPVHHQVDVHALDGGEEFATVETHELGPAGGVEGHVALLELLLAGPVGRVGIKKPTQKKPKKTHPKKPTQKTH